MKPYALHRQNRNSMDDPLSGDKDEDGDLMSISNHWTRMIQYSIRGWYIGFFDHVNDASYFVWVIIITCHFLFEDTLAFCCLVMILVMTLMILFYFVLNF